MTQSLNRGEDWKLKFAICEVTDMKELSVGATIARLVAMEEAKGKRSQYVTKEHIFIGICSLGKVSLDILAGMPESQRQAMEVEYHTMGLILNEFGLDLSQLRSKIRDSLPEGNYEHTEAVVHRNEACKKVFERADELAGSAGETSCLHLLAATILEEPGDIISSVLKELEINTSALREKALTRANAMKEELKDIDNKNELLIEELVKVNEKLAKILDEGFLQGTEGYVRKGVNYLRLITTELSKGLAIQSAIAFVEIIFVFYYSLGIWHYIIEERWKEISPLNKLIIGALFAIFVSRGAHFVLDKRRWKFGIGIGLLAAALGIIIYAVFVTVYKM